MNIPTVERYYKELRSEYLCLMDALDQFENNEDGSYNYDAFMDSGMDGFYNLTTERILELKSKMNFIEGMIFGISIEQSSKMNLPKLIDK